jgi:hypothetical protein
MYFPYLYGRQAELKAISDLAGPLGTPQKITPLLEPVDPAPKLIATLDKFKADGKHLYMVVNPDLGKLSDKGQRSIWDAEMRGPISDGSLVRPVYKETASTNVSEITAFAKANSGRHFGVLLTSSRLPPADVKTALAGTDHLVFLHPNSTPTIYANALTPSRTVYISDNFKPELRNKDYSGEKWLGNNHATWHTTGHAGFSDYTILPSTFTPGGGPVGAIALHMTYEHGGDLRVQHFVSATSDQSIPQAIKFKEALDELEAQISATPARFRKSPGLSLYRNQLAAGQFTNLSGSKSQQISHHIYTIGKHLGV